VTNDRYLIISYFGACAVTLGLGAAVYLMLRRPIAQLSQALLGNTGGRVMRSVLSITLLLASLAGFFGISYTENGCNRLKYEDVVKEKSYLNQVNRQQFHNSADWLLVTVLCWAAASLLGVIFVHRARYSNSTE
jgi:hypothetical protein